MRLKNNFLVAGIVLTLTFGIVVGAIALSILIPNLLVLAETLSHAL